MTPLGVSSLNDRHRLSGGARLLRAARRAERFGYPVVAHAVRERSKHHRGFCLARMAHGLLIFQYCSVSAAFLRKTVERRGRNRGTEFARKISGQSIERCSIPAV